MVPDSAGKFKFTTDADDGRGLEVVTDVCRWVETSSYTRTSDDCLKFLLHFPSFWGQQLTQHFPSFTQAQHDHVPNLSGTSTTRHHCMQLIACWHRVATKFQISRHAATSGEAPPQLAEEASLAWPENLAVIPAANPPRSGKIKGSSSRRPGDLTRERRDPGSPGESKMQTKGVPVSCVILSVSN